MDDYPTYNTDEHYYSQNPQTNYPNFAVYAAAATGSYPNDSMYYDQKRIRLDNEYHHHVFDYETNLSSEKLDFYSPTNNCCVSTNYQTEHPYHHTSVIVDSQQYFLNGWNGTTAF
jgi:hypothetical protein